MAVQLCREAVLQDAARSAGGGWGVILGSNIWEITVKFLVSQYKVKTEIRDYTVSLCMTSHQIIRLIFCSITIYF